MMQIQKETEQYILYSPDSLKYITDNMYDILDSSINFYKELFDIEQFRKIQINYFDNIDSFREYINKLNNKKPVILCGDLNVSHKEIDLKNPKTNKKNPGFSMEEREKFGKLLASGFIDTYRHFYPEKEGAYTWWSYRNGARENNIGWRIDYFVVSNSL
jgi:exodeoxyribonuclease III